MHTLLQGRRLQPAPRGAPNRLQPDMSASAVRRHRRCARQHALDQRGDVRERQRRFEKRADGDFVRGIQHRRRRAARLPPRCGPGARQGNAPGRALRNRGGRRAGCRAILHRRLSRSGQPSACAIGVRMSGLPSCASIEPSTYSTSECTMLCGWTTTSTCARRQAEQQAGLDQLQALVHERRRVDRDLAPHHPARMRASLIGRHVT